MLKVLQRIIRNLKLSDKETRRLLVSADGLTLIQAEQEIYRFNWAGVSRVEAYKRDLGSVDMICLDFTLSARRIAYMANDEMEGFDELTEQLTQHFPSVPTDWWSEAAFPAFATNHRVLFERTSLPERQ